MNKEKVKLKGKYLIVCNGDEWYSKMVDAENVEKELINMLLERGEDYTEEELLGLRNELYDAGYWNQSDEHGSVMFEIEVGFGSVQIIFISNQGEK